MAECGFRSEMSQDGGQLQEGRMGGGFGRILRVVDVSGKLLDSLDMCHYRGVSQILITIDAPAFSLAGACRRKVGEHNGSEGLSMP